MTAPFTICGIFLPPRKASAWCISFPAGFPCGDALIISALLYLVGLGGDSWYGLMARHSLTAEVYQGFSP
ncbi:MAG: hypothetical protein ACLRT5_04725 [Lachnospiraceae bacterium]